jgi:hypothetical protein
VAQLRLSARTLSGHAHEPDLRVIEHARELNSLVLRLPLLRYYATTPAGRSTAVGDVLHWGWIRWARAARCRTVDFGSSCTDIPPTETHPRYGIYRFKLELGARLTMFSEYHDRVFAAATYQAVRWLERATLRSAWRLRARVQRALSPRSASATSRTS